MGMKIKFLYVDKDGKITLTKKELDEIMTQCYNEGYEDAKKIYNGTLQSYYCNSTADGITTAVRGTNQSGSAFCSNVEINTTATAADTLS
jgi:hypothetical protein